MKGEHRKPRIALHKLTASSECDNYTDVMM